MSFILEKKEDAIMVKFDNLREQYINFCDERTKYWNNLSSEAMRLAKGFYDYLDVKGKSYIDNQGNEQQYLQLGVLDNQGNFQETTSFNYDDNLKVNFALRLTLDRDEKTFPKERAVISLSLKKEKGNYIVSFLSNGDGIKNFDVTNDNDVNHFYDALALDIGSMFDTKQF